MYGNGFGYSLEWVGEGEQGVFRGLHKGKRPESNWNREKAKDPEQAEYGGDQSQQLINSHNHHLLSIS